MEQLYSKTSYQIGDRIDELKNLSICGQWCIQGDDAPSSLNADRGVKLFVKWRLGISGPGLQTLVFRGHAPSSSKIQSILSRM